MPLSQCGNRTLMTSGSFDEFYTACPVCGHVKDKSKNPEICGECHSIYTWNGRIVESIRPIHYRALTVKDLVGDYSE